METPEATTWQLLRKACGFTQREAERRMGWKTGHLSWIERGIKPNERQEADMRRLYATVLLGNAERTA